MAAQREGQGGPLGRGGALHALCCAGGIIASLAGYGLLQEQLMTQPHGDDRAVFKHSLFLVLCNRLLTCCLSLALLHGSGQPWRPAAPLHCYGAVSLSNVAATTCQYEALKHVTFPIQTLGKCAKMLPVMAWGALLGKKRYKRAEVAVALLVSLGVLAFLLSGPARARRTPGGAASAAGGAALMLAYVALDGFTSAFQDGLFRGRATGVFNQMLYVNLCSAALAAAGLLASGQLLPALHFVRAHPQALRSILLLSLAATSGQLCILHTIQAFGALLFAAVMTLRQFLSILLSALLFGHPIKPRQWAAATLVFGALLYGSASRASGKRAQPGAQAAAGGPPGDGPEEAGPGRKTR